MIYLQLFLSYLKIGFFGFGGGYAMISLIQNEIVVQHQWITNMQLTDIIAISQMTPGPIAINCATYVGYTVTGNIWGSLLATTAVSIPPMTIMIVIAKFYQKLHNNKYMNGALQWMRPMMVGMIAAAALMFLNKETFIDWKSYVIFGVCVIATWFKFSPILLIIMAAITEILLY
ncbi:MAG: chromate transporter [Bacteroidales bacterium]|nr:chromate transporter [Bacteroidales bacterium]MDD4671227.1 chromate transporter [Bacteroidales bacterium]